jgi:hypothetical protein
MGLLHHNLIHLIEDKQVEKINSENELLKLKVNELTSDEFINTYHQPQTKTIVNNFSALYTTIYNCVESYVQPRINGAGLKKPISMHKYYM